tara:strand:- start:3217 stop:4035 length:819 start_codon:yes stop_codon:yes gene_type:complete
MEIREIRQIRNPRIEGTVIDQIPRPVISASMPELPTVISALEVPVVDIPDAKIDYPEIDMQTQAEFEEVVEPQSPVVPQEPQKEEQKPPDKTRELPVTPSIPQAPPITPTVPTTPSVNVGGLDIPLPEPAPLVAAGSMAVVTTVVTLGATIAVGQAKQALEPLIKSALKPKRKKIKVKQVKPVLHFVPNDDGTAEIIQYSAKGMKVLEGGIEKLEQYLRDQVEIDALWEYDNKIIIDEALSKSLTKEGQKRFKKYFTAPKVIAKKLGSSFAF